MALQPSELGISQPPSRVTRRSALLHGFAFYAFDLTTADAYMAAFIRPGCQTQELIFLIAELSLHFTRGISGLYTSSSLFPSILHRARIHPTDAVPHSTLPLFHCLLLELLNPFQFFPRQFLTTALTSHTPEPDSRALSAKATSTDLTSVLFQRRTFLESAPRPLHDPVFHIGIRNKIRTVSNFWVRHFRSSLGKRRISITFKNDIKRL